MKAEFSPPILSVRFEDEEQWRKAHVIQGMRNLALGSTFHLEQNGFSMEPNLVFFYDQNRVVERVEALLNSTPKLVTVHAHERYL